MKLKSLIFFSTALLTFILSGCAEKPWSEPMLSLTKPVDDGTVTFTTKGGTEILKLVCTRDWEITDIPAWVSVTPESGPASTSQIDITVEVPENIGKDRQARLTVKGATEKEYVTIYQVGPEGEDDGIIDATVAQVIEEADPEQCYRLTGKVSGFNAAYCSFDIQDATGKIYVYSVTTESKNAYASKISNGDTVTIEGYYEFYAAKSQHEIKNARIVDWKEGSDEPSGDVIPATVAEVIAAQNETQVYRLTGKVSGFNPTYCSFDLTDATGKIYVYSVTAATKQEYSSKLSNGDIVTIEGNYLFYTQKSQHEIVNAKIVEWTSGGGQSGGEAVDATVSTVISEANDTKLYRLTGKVSGFNPAYCSFDLTDATGKIYVYSVTAATKQEYSSKLGNGDTVTIEGYYQFYEPSSKHEIINATITSWTDGEPPAKAITHPLTSSLVWTLGNKGTNVIANVEGTEYDALKLGTSSIVGEASITVPSGSKALHFYAVGWKGVDGKIRISGGGTDQTVTAVSDNGAANNSPFTLIDISDANYITITFDAALASDTNFKFTTVSPGVRAIIIGLNAE